MSSTERTIRHGELKKLKSMKYELKNSMRTSNRKHLKYRYGANADDDEEQTYSKGDIRDVDFRINHDYETLQVKLFDCCDI